MAIFTCITSVTVGTVSPWRLEVQVGDTIRKRHQKQLAHGSYLQFCVQSTSPRTTVFCTSGTFNPRNGRNACRNIMSPSSVKGGHTGTWYSNYGLKRSWSFLYIVGCVRARPDTSNGNPWKAWAKIPTQRARTASEVLLVLSELRELFKTLSCISISTRRYRCVRFLFFSYLYFKRGHLLYPVLCARVDRSMFTICSGGHASDAYCVLLFKFAFVNTWNLSTF